LVLLVGPPGICYETVSDRTFSTHGKQVYCAVVARACLVIGTVQGLLNGTCRSLGRRLGVCKIGPDASSPKARQQQCSDAVNDATSLLQRTMPNIREETTGWAHFSQLNCSVAFPRLVRNVQPQIAVAEVSPNTPLACCSEMSLKSPPPPPVSGTPGSPDAP
jgi:hypothetical protein